MHIILLRDIPRLGSKWEVKNVRAGYARNLLIPKNAAIIFSQEVGREVRVRQKRESEKRRIHEESLVQAAAALAGKSITLRAKTGTKNQLFAAINEDQLAEAIEKEHHLLIPAANIVIPNPIKHSGEHTAQISIPESKETIPVRIMILPDKED